MSEDGGNLRALVAEVSAAYFSNVHVAPSDIGDIIMTISRSLQGVGGEAAASDASDQTDQAPQAPALTAAQIRKSIKPDALISFEDNKPYKTLKRHLGIRGMTPADYRQKWGLPADYPMVAPSYSAARSAMAKTIGLGQKGRGKAPAAKVGRGRRKAPPS